jgi:hypothetical protein
MVDQAITFDWRLHGGNAVLSAVMLAVVCWFAFPLWLIVPTAFFTGAAWCNSVLAYAVYRDMQQWDTGASDREKGA